MFCTLLKFLINILAETVCICKFLFILWVWVQLGKGIENRHLFHLYCTCSFRSGALFHPQLICYKSHASCHGYRVSCICLSGIFGYVWERSPEGRRRLSMFPDSLCPAPAKVECLFLHLAAAKTPAIFSSQYRPCDSTNARYVTIVRGCIWVSVEASHVPSLLFLPSSLLC